MTEGMTTRRSKPSYENNFLNGPLDSQDLIAFLCRPSLTKVIRLVFLWRESRLLLHMEEAETLSAMTSDDKD